MKQYCTAIFSGPTSCGKTELVSNLIENEYKHHFENIIILWPTMRWNKTYRDRSWIWQDDYVFCVERGGKLYQILGFLSKTFTGEETLFVIDDIIADESLDKKRQPLLELAISGRHEKYSLWLLTQSYTTLTKNLRRRKKMLFCWFPNEKSDLKLIDEESNIIPEAEMRSIQTQLKTLKHACLYLRLEHPRKYHVINASDFMLSDCKEFL